MGKIRDPLLRMLKKQNCAMDNKSESRVHSIPVGDLRDTGEKESDSESFPDAGLRAWLVVLGAFFGLFVSFGWTNCTAYSSFHGNIESCEN